MASDDAAAAGGSSGLHWRAPPACTAARVRRSTKRPRRADSNNAITVSITSDGLIATPTFNDHHQVAIVCDSTIGAVEVAATDVGVTATRSSKRIKLIRNETNSEEVTVNKKKNNRNDTKKKGRKQTARDEETRISEVAATTAAASERFKPHTLLKLPQSIASALASDYLTKLEIRDLGLTCRWMLVSLNQCEIRESVPLKWVVRRWKRQATVAGSQKVCARTTALRQHLSRIPNLFIGRLRSTHLSLNPYDFTTTDLNLVLQFHRLTDVHKLTFDGYDHSQLVQGVPFPTPLILPPNLKEIFMENVLRLPPISEIIFPDSVERISFTAFGFYQTSQHLKRIKWPASLTELLNLHDKDLSMDGLVLPEGLLKVNFTRFSDVQPIINITLPSSITNLEINKWQDRNGRYRDLHFPSSLKRLILMVDVETNDLNLTEWAHLPHTCENLKLQLRVNTESHSNNSSDVPAVLSSSVARIPSFVKHLRINLQTRDKQRTLSLLALLDLSHATSLLTLETNGLDLIRWPASVVSTTASISSSPAIATIDRGSLSTVKLSGMFCDDLIRSLTLLPSTVTDLEICGSYGWDAVVKNSSNLNWSTIFPQQIQFKKIIFSLLHGDIPASAYISMLCDWSRVLPSDCMLEGEIYLNYPSRRELQLISMDLDHLFIRYVNGRIVQQSYLTGDEFERMQLQRAELRQRFDPAPVLN